MQRFTSPCCVYPSVSSARPWVSRMGIRVYLALQPVSVWTLHCCLWDRQVVDTANSPLPPPSPLFFYPFLLSFLLGAPLALGTEPKCFKRWLIFKGTESGIAQEMAGCSTDKQTHLLLLFPKPARSSQETVTTQPRQTRRPPHPRSNCETLLQLPEAINSLFKKPLWGLSRPDGRSLFAAPSNKWRKKF